MRIARKIILHSSLIALPFLYSCVPEQVTISRPMAIVLVSPKASPGTIRQPVLRVEGVSPDHAVRLFSDSNCQTEIGSQVSTSTSVSITTNILNFGTNNIYANAISPDGTASACSTAFVTYKLISKPSLSKISDEIINEDQEKVISFTALDEDDLNFGCSSVRATSSNDSLIPLSSIFITGSGTNCSLKLKPLKDQFVPEPVIVMDEEEMRELLFEDTRTELHPKVKSSASEAVKGIISSASSSIILSLMSDREGLAISL